MEELPSAASERHKVLDILRKHSEGDTSPLPTDPLFAHLSHGLAYTVGSALGSTPPSSEECLAAFLLPNKANLTAGARAWSKHSHRSGNPSPQDDDLQSESNASTVNAKDRWWGTPSGPVAVINERALSLFWRVKNGASWRNLHWLPHQVLVYEIRVPEGYGMRWSQDRSKIEDGNEDPPWTFRGFVEPMMENGHEVGWRH
jgi:hypothetical protein